MNSSKGRHRAQSRAEAVIDAVRTPARRAVVVGTIPLAIAVAASGVAIADPAQPGTTTQSPQQPGTTTPAQPGTSTTPSQPGATTTPKPQAAPRPDLEGPGLIPDPPVLPSREIPTYDSDDYSYNDNAYYSEPAQDAPQEAGDDAAPAPQPEVNLAPIAPPENKVRFGDFVTDKPDWVPPEAARSANRWAAYGESEIARSWNRAGVSPQRSDRLAATATAAGVTGAVVGAGVGAVVAFPVSIATGAGGAVIGALIGGAVPCAITPVNAIACIGLVATGGAAPAVAAVSAASSAAGAGIGAVAGFAAGEAAGIAIGAVTGAVIGVGIGTALSNGDPNQESVAPQILPTPHDIAQAVVNTTNSTVDFVQAQPGGTEALNALPGVAAQATAIAKQSGPVADAVVTAGQQANDAFVAWQLGQPGGNEIVSAAQEAGAGMPTEVAQIGGAAHGVYYAG
ncbi:hypothetical protein OG921_03180 [Aldersonia sp. NBC_00410]|uniref:hypothetical protein n=1 Tax=Aldersonia sp. NBC_00410 TaxID=2975954 RepID=UPI0022524048|nr:hypothetical protein [Aldersonia sp. NBC_00410]MCX5042194.1 hypothetical protein [Aldersonia sp. NBC_00410]